MASRKKAKPKHRHVAFEESLKEVRSREATTWTEVEQSFIDVVTAFDAEYAQGKREKGWYQLKARYFNDLVVAIIENATGEEISTRSKKRSVLFSEIDIDMCFPGEGDPIVAAEVKALGTPPHPGNDFVARKAYSDLHKRVREVAFTSMDIKAAYAKPRIISSFQSWVDTTEPAYSSFWAMRVAGESDLSQVRSILSSRKSYCNGVGAVIYGVNEPSASYVVKPYPEFAMDRAIRDFTQRVISSRE